MCGAQPLLLAGRCDRDFSRHAGPAPDIGDTIRDTVTDADPTRALRDLLAAFEGEAPARAIALARHLQTRAAALQTREEKRQQAELERMLQSPEDRATLTQMTDQAFRARSPRRAAEQLTHILDVQGVPRFFGPVDRAMLKGFQSFGGHLPGF